MLFDIAQLLSEMILKIYIQRCYFYVTVFPVPFAHFVCDAICGTPFMDHISTYEDRKNQFQDFNTVPCCCHLMFIALHLCN